MSKQSMAGFDENGASISQVQHPVPASMRMSALLEFCV